MDDTGHSKKGPTTPFSDREFELLFNEHYLPLCRFALKITGQPDVAEDIVQEQYVYLWEHRSAIRKRESLPSYLYTAVRHRTYSYLKSRTARLSRIGDVEDEAASMPITIPDPLTNLENQELGQLLERALESLPEKCRSVFTLKKFEGLSHKEIAAILSISVKTVEAQMTIAFKKLTEFISQNWPLLLVFSSALTVS